jgi:RNA polymerase sigma-70 factor (ECF subfamily)
MTQQPERIPSDRRPPTGASDAELLEAIAAGSEGAFEELCGRYRRAVKRICGSAGSDREDCEQEVFARIWRKAGLFDPRRGSAAGWLLTVARRTAVSVRAGHATAPLDEEALAGAAEPADLDAFWLDGALARLGERERTVIELSYFDDLSESVIARRLRVPLGSVKSWKRRGLNRLATLLGEESA